MKQADFQDKEKETQDQRSQNSTTATEAFFIAIMGAFVLLEYGMIHTEMIYRFFCYAHAKSHQDLHVIVASLVGWLALANQPASPAASQPSNVLFSVLEPFEFNRVCFRNQSS